MKKISILILSITVCFISINILAINNNVINQKEDKYIPKEGYVPNKETAIKIAEAIWLPIYGNEIYKEKPFVAELSKDKKVWKIFGTLPKGYLGGTAYAEIRKSDCKILMVTHYE